jgi:circadian clock protein KaiB
MADKRKTTREFEKAIAQADTPKFILTLYVAGMTPRSLKAIENAKQLCREHLAGRCELEIVDIYQQPGQARDAQIIAAPTLVKHLPMPLQKFVGDLSDPEPILIRLAVKLEAASP